MAQSQVDNKSPNREKLNEKIETLHDLDDEFVNRNTSKAQTVVNFKPNLNVQQASGLNSFQSLRKLNTISNLGKGNANDFQNNPNFNNLKLIREQILHSDLNLNELGDQSYQCVHHGKREYFHENGAIKQEITTFDPKSVINYYCEDCREFCCEYCIALGPHNNELHKVSFLKSFAERYQDFIDKFLRSSTNQKCSQLFNKIKQMNERQDLISNQAQVIERDAYIEFTHILERLNLAEGNKISVLQNDIARIQRDVNSIEDTVKAFENLASREDRLPFLLFYRSLNQHVIEALSLHVKQEITQTPYDLPREISSIKVQMENFKPNDEILKFKDLIIWDLIEEKNKHLESIRVLQTESYQSKLELWTELAKKTFEEFESIQLICHYCGELINDDIINQDCFNNQIFKDRDRSIPIIVYSDEVMERGVYGSKRHFWVKPRLRDRQIKLGQLPNIQAGKRKGINRSVAYYNYMKLYQLMFALIKKKKAEKGVDLEQIFQGYDKERSGYCSIIQFQYVLNTVLDLEIDYVERATEFLGTTQKEVNRLNGIPDDEPYEEKNYGENPFASSFLTRDPVPEKPTLVNYIVFLKIMQNPAYLEYESFKVIDYAHIKLHGQNYFIQLDDDLYKQCRLDGNTKVSQQNAKGDFNSTLRDGYNSGKFSSSSYGRTDFNSTLRK
ncbi:hypothetical protein ABPG72_012338 [Tetrahymena utriculariae]